MHLLWGVTVIRIKLVAGNSSQNRTLQHSQVITVTTACTAVHCGRGNMSTPLDFNHGGAAQLEALRQDGADL